ncbi:MAG: FecR domain-containing protein [Acidovorax sp.]|nr:FecR domain-containing protein [Acidovorax sp.]
MDRYKAALRTRFPAPEEIFRGPERRRRARRAATRAGAATAAIAVLAASLWIVDPVYRSETFATAVGETRAHMLADGSTVALNTGSALDVQWRLRSRQLHLARGEAMFRVAHGARDFVVHTSEASIRDIGTAFNVRLGGVDGKPGVIVTVVEGAVEVRTGPKAAVLTAGQTVFAASSGLEPPHATDLAASTAWQRGKLVFDGMPLDRAVAEMRRYHATPIVLDIPDAQASALRLSGEFDHRRVDTLLDLLPTILPVRLRRLPDGKAVISARAVSAGRP